MSKKIIAGNSAPSTVLGAATVLLHALPTEKSAVLHIPYKILKKKMPRTNPLSYIEVSSLEPVGGEVDEGSTPRNYTLLKKADSDVGTLLTNTGSGVFGIATNPEGVARLIQPSDNVIYEGTAPQQLKMEVNAATGALTVGHAPQALGTSLRSIPNSTLEDRQHRRLATIATGNARLFKAGIYAPDKGLKGYATQVKYSPEGMTLHNFTPGIYTCYDQHWEVSVYDSTKTLKKTQYASLLYNAKYIYDGVNYDFWGYARTVAGNTSFFIGATDPVPIIAVAEDTAVTSLPRTDIRYSTATVSAQYRDGATSVSGSVDITESDAAGKLLATYTVPYTIRRAATHIEVGTGRLVVTRKETVDFEQPQGFVGTDADPAKDVGKAVPEEDPYAGGAPPGFSLETIDTPYYTAPVMTREATQSAEYIGGGKNRYSITVRDVWVSTTRASYTSLIPQVSFADVHAPYELTRTTYSTTQNYLIPQIKYQIGTASRIALPYYIDEDSDPGVVVYESGDMISDTTYVSLFSEDTVDEGIMYHKFVAQYPEYGMLNGQQVLNEHIGTIDRGSTHIINLRTGAVTAGVGSFKDLTLNTITTTYEPYGVHTVEYSTVSTPQTLHVTEPEFNGGSVCEILVPNIAAVGGERTQPYVPPTYAAILKPAYEAADLALGLTLEDITAATSTLTIRTREPRVYSGGVPGTPGSSRRSEVYSYVCARYSTARYAGIHPRHKWFDGTYTQHPVQLLDIVDTVYRPAYQTRNIESPRASLHIILRDMSLLYRYWTTPGAVITNFVGTVSTAVMEELVYKNGAVTIFDNTIDPSKIQGAPVPINPRYLA